MGGVLNFLKINFDNGEFRDDEKQKQMNKKMIRLYLCNPALSNISPITAEFDLPLCNVVAASSNPTSGCSLT